MDCPHPTPDVVWQRRSHICEFVFDVVEQVLRVVQEFALRVQCQAAAKRVRRSLVQCSRLQDHDGGRSPREFVRREFIAPAERVPKPRVIRSKRNRALDQFEAFRISALTRDEHGREVLDRLNKARIKDERAPRERNTRDYLVRALKALSLGEQHASLLSRIAQRIAHRGGCCAPLASGLESGAGPKNGFISKYCRTRNMAPATR